MYSPWRVLAADELKLALVQILLKYEFYIADHRPRPKNMCGEAAATGYEGEVHGEAARVGCVVWDLEVSDSTYR